MSHSRSGVDEKSIVALMKIRVAYDETDALYLSVIDCISHAWNLAYGSARKLWGRAKHAVATKEIGCTPCFAGSQWRAVIEGLLLTRSQDREPDQRRQIWFDLKDQIGATLPPLSGETKRDRIYTIEQLHSAAGGFSIPLMIPEPVPAETKVEEEAAPLTSKRVGLAIEQTANGIVKKLKLTFDETNYQQLTDQIDWAAVVKRDQEAQQRWNLLSKEEAQAKLQWVASKRPFW